ncbi:MucBP domain-containing protein [Streptococcus himalayensis]|uniref:Gram-positive cocci surface proteins LPxTG domain-containing protein n=1 Tax=Streptococcus himalayensis TaxID=1888195 RepID=A0A917AAT6_9STRE|nr:MucBP domain-containing protein [Streptococcus himalayensis]GGE37879.1 hypothetical protein GCM10011510_19060 [Streptococcus himalayensis]
MERKNKYSIRKFKMGVGSVLIGFALAGGAMVPVFADEVANNTATTATADQEQPDNQDTYGAVAPIKDYLINENPNIEYGKGTISEPNENRRVTVQVGTKPVVEEKIVDGKEAVSTTNYTVIYPLVNAETNGSTLREVADVVENVKAENYKDLVTPYEDVELKEYNGPQDSLVLQGFGEEGRLDLNKFLKPISDNWNNTTADTKRGVEFRFEGSDGNTTYFRVFPGADGGIRPDDLRYRDLKRSFSDDVNESSGFTTNGSPGYTDFSYYMTRLSRNNFLNGEVGQYNYFTKVLNPRTNEVVPEKRMINNQLYLYNGEKDVDLNLKVSYRYYYSAELPYLDLFIDFRGEGERPRFNTGSWSGETYKPNDTNPWETIGDITLKPHITYIVGDGSKPAPNLARQDQNLELDAWYRKPYSVDVSPTATVDGDYTVYRTYKLDAKTGERVVVNEERIKTADIPTSQDNTTFNAQMIGLSLPKFNKTEGAEDAQAGTISISENPLLKLVHDSNFNVSKSYLVELYKKVYGATTENDKNRVAAALSEYKNQDLVRRAANMDDPKDLYGFNNLPYRKDVAKQAELELAAYIDNADPNRSSVLVPDVLVRHWVRNSSDDPFTLHLEEQKGPITMLNEYYTKGSKDVLDEGYKYLRAEHTDQQYIYKVPKTDNDIHLVESRVRYSEFAIERMGTVAPPFFSGNGYDGAGFNVDYGYFPFVEAVDDKRAEEVRNNPNGEYRVYDRARHVRTIDVYYEVDPKTTESEEKGHVVVHYVDEKGNPIDKDKTYPEVVVNKVKTTTYPGGREPEIEKTPTKETYDVEPDKRDTITYEGFEYKFTAVKDNKELSGILPAGTTEITYIYSVVPKTRVEEEKGSVFVTYQTIGGTIIKARTAVVDGALLKRRTITEIPGETASDTESYPVDYQTAAKDIEDVNGVPYKLVGLADTSAPAGGKVEVGEKEVIYLYAPIQDEVIKTEVKGSVAVRYVDKETGLEIHDQNMVVTDGIVRTETRTIRRYAEKDGTIKVLSDETVSTPTNATYDSSLKRLATIDANGATYYYVEADKPETATLEEGLTVITYKYLKPTVVTQTVTGHVTVHYIISGTTTVLKDPVETMENTVVKTTTTETLPGKAPVSTDVNHTVNYNTVPLAPSILVKDDVEYVLVVTPENSTGKVVEGNTDVTYEYLPKIVEEKHEELKGSVVVHYVDEAGNPLLPNNNLVTDVLVKIIDTTVIRNQNEPLVKKQEFTSPYTAHREETLVREGKTYQLVRVSDSHKVGETDVVASEARIGGETGNVQEGVTDVIYVYKLLETPKELPNQPESGTGETPPPTPSTPSYVPYVPTNPAKPDPKDPNPTIHIPEVPYDETPENPSDNPRLPEVPGYIPVDPQDPTKPLSEDPNGGYIPPTPADPKQPTAIPYLPAGSVTVHYETADGQVLKLPTLDTVKAPVGATYHTNENGQEIPAEIHLGKETYVLVGVKEGDHETGTIVKGNIDVTYIYKLKELPNQPESGTGETPPPTPSNPSYVPYVPTNPAKPDPKDPNPTIHIPEVPYDETPENPSDDPRLPEVPGYIPVDPQDPTKPLPEDPNGGYIPPTPADPNHPTAIPYLPAGSVTVHYETADGQVLKLPTLDTVKAPVGATYHTNENGQEIPAEIHLGKETYVLVGVKEGDHETGTIVKGNIDVTYIYKLKELPNQPESGTGETPPPTPSNPSYVPYVPTNPAKPDPKDPNPTIHIPEVPYDETPENPSDDPRLPEVPGYIPVDPQDPTKPLPEDPNGGYIPPTPADPKQPTAIPYLPAGSVTVHYETADGQVLKLPTLDTVKAPVGTTYHTNENGQEIPAEIHLGKETYELVGVKEGDHETGTIVKGNIDVTYIYKLKELPNQPESGTGETPPPTPSNPSYVPYVPTNPAKPDPKDPNPTIHIPEVPYDETPENPSDDPRLPEVPGYIPVDPQDPTKPLPEDPNGGYIPPTPADPNHPTAIPYLPAGSVTVHYETADGQVLKLPTLDTVKAPVGATYHTNENGQEIPAEIHLGKETYVLVGVKEGDYETGTIVKGNIDVTYIYKLKENLTPPVEEEKPSEETPEKPESGKEIPDGDKPQPDGDKPGMEIPGKPGVPTPAKPAEPGQSAKEINSMYVAKGESLPNTGDAAGQTGMVYGAAALGLTALLAAMKKKSENED